MGSGNWKTNLEQSVLEEVPVQDKYKRWIDQVSSMFGGLALCSLEAVVAKDGTEYIIEVNDCAMGLLGERQEDDKMMIAEMVLKEMEIKCKVPGKKEVPDDGLRMTDDGVEMTDDDREMVDSGIGRNICRTDSHDSSVSSPSTMSESSMSSSNMRKDRQEDEEQEIENNEKNDRTVEGEDTMKNLRTSFAGLFGDLK